MARHGLEHLARRSRSSRELLYSSGRPACTVEHAIETADHRERRASPCRTRTACSRHAAGPRGTRRRRRGCGSSRWVANDVSAPRARRAGRPRAYSPVRSLPGSRWRLTSFGLATLNRTACTGLDVPRLSITAFVSKTMAPLVASADAVEEIAGSGPDLQRACEFDNRAEPRLAPAAFERAPQVRSGCFERGCSTRNAGDLAGVRTMPR